MSEGAGECWGAAQQDLRHLGQFNNDSDGEGAMRERVRRDTSDVAAAATATSRGPLRNRKRPSSAPSDSCDEPHVAAGFVVRSEPSSGAAAAASNDFAAAASASGSLRTKTAASAASSASCHEEDVRSPATVAAMGDTDLRTLCHHVANAAAVPGVVSAPAVLTGPNNARGVAFTVVLQP